MTHPPLSISRTGLLGLTLVASATVCASTAIAETPPARLETVQVALQRDPAALAYARINALLLGLREHGQGLFAMDFKLKLKQPPPRPPKLAILHPDVYLPITLDAEQRLELPVLPPEQARDAEIATNLPRGTVGFEGRLRLTPRADQLDMALVRRIMATGHKLRSELLPWYLRWMFPQLLGVRICSAEPRWELEWRENGQLLGLPLSADPSDRDPDAPQGGPARSCTTLSGEERWPDAARLLAPPDASLSVRLARNPAR